MSQSGPNQPLVSAELTAHNNIIWMNCSDLLIRICDAVCIQRESVTLFHAVVVTSSFCFLISFGDDVRRADGRQMLLTLVQPGSDPPKDVRIILSPRL